MSEAFEWKTDRHELRVRRLRVVRTRLVAHEMLRVTLTGDELAGFTDPGPADHVKAFFPGEDGTILAPTVVDGRPQRPEHGTPITRDYTPAGFRAGGENGDGAPELDLDFYLHLNAGGHGGPAANWAAKAAPGDELVIAGPRGSHLPPRDVDALVVVADETALPAAVRWIRAFEGTPITCLVTLTDQATLSYLDEFEGRADVTVRQFASDDASGSLERALRSLPIGDRTLVFLAGEANSIVPLRRYLRRELGLSKQQVDAHGYWKRGVVALDHHAPLDPSDPD